MEAVVMSALDEGRLDLLREALLNLDFFEEAAHAFSYVPVSQLQQEFNELTSLLKPINLHSGQTYQLKTSYLYCFLTDGFFMQKKSSKEGRIDCSKKSDKRKVNPHRLTEMNNPFSNVEAVKKGQISQIQHFLEANKKTFALFYSNSQALLLSLSHSRISSSLLNKLKGWQHEKVKFISKFEVLERVSKNTIQENLEKFVFKKLIFNDILYDDKNHTSSLFFLQSGEVIIKFPESKQSIIVKAPNILGYSKMKDEMAKCATQFCIVYCVSLSFFDKLIKIKGNEEESDSQGFFQNANFLLRTNYIQKEKHTSIVDRPRFLCELIDGATERQDTTRRQCCTVSKSVQKRKGRNNDGKKSLNIQEKKKLKIREFFSNHLNEQFEEYEAKKARGINLNSSSQPILYEMKPLISKLPEYEGMNRKLKEIRIRKILEFKDLCKKSKQSQKLFLTSSNLENSPSLFTNDQVNNKILRTLQIKMASKMSKGYHTYDRVKFVK